MDECYHEGKRRHLKGYVVVESFRAVCTRGEWSSKAVMTAQPSGLERGG
jgi:hypothetical protein